MQPIDASLIYGQSKELMVMNNTTSLRSVLAMIGTTLFWMTSCKVTVVLARASDFF